MSVIAVLQAWHSDSGLLEDDALLSVDHVGQEPVQYGLIPLPGRRVIERYLDDSAQLEFPFAIQATFYTADDASRLQNSDWMERVANFYELATNSDELPDLGDGKEAVLIEAVNAGFLMEQGESGTGIYQITGRLVYDQEAVTSEESE